MALEQVIIPQGMKFDFIDLEQSNENEANIFASSTYKPQLTNNTRFLATFDNSTTTATGIVTSSFGYEFDVYKSSNNDGLEDFKYVATIGEGGLSLNDFNINNNDNYTYYIFKNDNTKSSQVVQSNTEQTCWSNFTIVDIAPSLDNNSLYYANQNNVWEFDLNLSSGQSQQNTSNTTYNNLTKYPKVSMGKSNYSTGSVTCILGNIRNSNNQLSYYEPVSMLQQWNDFCENGFLKLMKDRKGNVRVVTITGTSSQVDNVTREQATTITFNWTEVMDASSISIIGD